MIENLQPFGSTVRPEAELAFEIDGEAYSISKGFAQKPSARLSTPNSTFKGPAAEEMLAELLRFRHAQRGASKPEYQGVLGLFHLEQRCIILSRNQLPLMNPQHVIGRTIAAGVRQLDPAWERQHPLAGRDCF